MRLPIGEKKALTRETAARYRAADKQAKHTILDEFTRVTGYHRKYSIYLLGTGGPNVSNSLMVKQFEWLSAAHARISPDGELHAGSMMSRSYRRCGACGNCLTTCVANAWRCSYG